MALIGVRELRQKTTEILRHLQSDGESYIITQRGRPVALLLPLDREKIEAEMLRSAQQVVADGWQVYQRLADKMRQKWPSGLTTQSLLDEIRV